MAVDSQSACVRCFIQIDNGGRGESGGTCFQSATHKSCCNGGKKMIGPLGILCANLLSLPYKRDMGKF